MTVLSDDLIAHLLSMPKVVITPRVKPKVQKRSEQANYRVESIDGAKSFELYTRQNQLDPDHFSCGLVFYPASGEKVTLTRYNGSNHVHFNRLEGGERIVNRCHIHKATCRYMEAGDKCEKYAETTERYSTMHEALACLLGDCNISGFELPDDGDQSKQISLF